MTFLFGGIVGLALFVLWLYVILEVITTDSGRCRNLPKFGWLVLVIVLPDIGSVAWLLLGRPQNQRIGLGGARPSSTSRFRSAPLGIEDRPDWPDASRKLADDQDAAEREAEKQKIRDAVDERSRKLRAWESRLIQREKDIHDRERKGDDENGSTE